MSHLQQRQLGDFLFYLGETNADTDQANLFPGPGKGLFK